MTLEHVVQLDRPIVELALSTDTPDDPLILVIHAPDSSTVVHAMTGSRDMTVTRSLLSRPGFTGIRRVSVAGLSASTSGGDIVLSNGHVLAAHTTSILTLGVCGQLLMSASEGGSIRLWDVRTRKQRRVGLQQSNVTSLLSFTGSDGRLRIASGGPDGSLYIWNPQLPAPPRIGPVATRGFSDRVAEQDLLNRYVLVFALLQILRPGDKGPTVFTVEGAWGSGKSSLPGFVRTELLTILEHTLGKETDPERPERRLTVFGVDRMLYQPPVREQTEREPANKQLVATFNPWQHQSSEQVWAGLATALAAAAEPALMPDQNAKERYWFAKNVHRVDRRHLQRQLWKRIYSPLLSFAGLGFGLSALGALTKLNLTWAWWVTAGLAGLGLLHTAGRYFFGQAAAFLPGELFAGPVASNAFSGPSTDPLIRDPYYHAKSGYLYLVQHDVKAVLDDLADQRYQLVVLIDDLDRCTPRTTAQVFEAISVFLSEDFPAIRFVLGLDTSVVASHVDHAYKELADAKVVAHPDDPSPGWTFLRKLVQLPVRLPRTDEDNVDRVLLAQLGPVHEENDDAEPSPEQLLADLAVDNAGDTLLTKVDEEVVVAIEQHPEVREHLRRRLRAQPEQSVREEKRLVNVWQFYLRVVESDVEQACHLVAVAEIAVRWPAYLHRLRGGWQDLADAVGDDVRWGATIARLGFAYSDRKAAANLRELLRDCDAQAVARLANRLF